LHWDKFDQGRKLPSITGYFTLPLFVTRKGDPDMVSGYYFMICKLGKLCRFAYRCSHSNLPQIMDGLKAVERNIKGRIDELVLENNQLPALPGRFFGSLQIVRLMLRHNSIERVSNGWLNELENGLVEIFVVEPQLRSIPAESLNGMINMLAITIQSEERQILAIQLVVLLCAPVVLAELEGLP